MTVSVPAASSSNPPPSRPWPMQACGRRALVLAAALAGAGVLTGAARAADPSGNQLDSVIVTGTRSAGVKARESVTPIDVVQGETLVATGQTTLLDALRDVLPSISTVAVGYDVGALARTFQLRGLSPGHTLVLVNGKRRHVSASLYADSDPSQGSNAVDLDLIPLAAVDHVEVLRDGAAAQYGSDAIAGVINVILKQDAKEGTVSLLGGRYEDGGGATGQFDVSHGFALGSGGTLNLSAGYRDHETSNRSGDSGGVQPALLQGDPQVQTSTLSFNLDLPVNTALAAYGFGSVAHRNAIAYENPRQPGWFSDAVDALYPNGFSPRETISEDDFSLNGGVRGVGAGGWHWDAGLGFGRDEARMGNIDTVNPDLLADFGNAQTRFDVGSFTSSEADATLDLRQPLTFGGLPAPVEVAFGAEVRREEFRIGAGEPNSYYQGGAQAFPGFQPTDRIDAGRNSIAAYLDLSTHFTADWEADAALREEHYDQVGGSLAGKLSTRFALSSTWALRGALSNGFHAPTLAQEHYSATTVTTGFAQVQLPLGSPGARLLGAPDLRPETSHNVSLGLVGEPAKEVHLSVDAYQIDIDNRIIQSGSISGPLVAASVAANGAVVPAGVDPGNVTAAFFTNGVDTRTRGLDVVLDLRSDLDAYGWIKWQFNATLNKTSIRHVHDAPAPLQAAGLSLVDVVQVSNLTTASPHARAALSGTWHQELVELTLRESFYAPTTQVQGYAPGPYYTYGNRAAWITDLDLAFDLAPRWRAEIGANNLFNQMPNKVPPAVYQALNYDQYSHVSPYGINGGFWYARVSLAF